MTKHLVVVAPTLNEEESVENFVKSVFAQKKSLPSLKLSLVIADSRSTDQTPVLVRSLQKTHSSLHFVEITKKGLGAGLVSGLDYATENLKADYIVTMESDLSNDPHQLPIFVKKLHSCDLVVGSRYMKGGAIKNWSWWRKALSLMANEVLCFFAGHPPIHEFTNLYRGFTGEVWRVLRPLTKMHTDWIFVPAFIFHSLDQKFTIREVPITYFDRFGGRSKMKTLSYTKNLLHFALRYWLKKSWNTF